MSSIQQSLLEKVLKAQVAQNFLNDNISEQEIAERVELMVNGNLGMSLMSDEIAKRAIAKDGTSIRYVPQIFCTENLCQKAVQQNSQALKDIPIQFRTLNVCLTSFENNQSVFDDIPNKIKLDMIPKLSEELLQDENVKSFVEDNFEKLVKLNSLSFMKDIARQIGVDSKAMYERPTA